MASHQGAVTLFVITDLLENSDFASTLQHALEAFSDRLTVGCLGHTHRSWSAWGEDVEGFRTMLQTSTTSLKPMLARVSTVLSRPERLHCPVDGARACRGRLPC